MSDKEGKIERFLKDTEVKCESLYRAGYKDGKNDAHKEWYEKGLQDAFLSVDEIYGMTNDERYGLFSHYAVDSIIASYEPMEILEKLSQRTEEL